MCSLLAKTDSGSHYKYMYTSIQYVLQGYRPGRGLGGVALEILSSCYYVYKQLPQKDVQNLDNTHTKIKA